MHEGEIMESEIYKIHKGTIVHRRLPPLDVRIVAYFLYGMGFLLLALSLLLSIGVARSPESHRVLLGTVAVASGTVEAVYRSCTSVCTLFCAWGLLRHTKFAWWFTVMFHMYLWADAALSSPASFSRYPLNMAIGGAISMSLFAWLWYRKELYGVHFAGSRTKK